MADRGSGLDLLDLAEAVVAGRRSLDNVIDQISMAVPDGAARRREVAEVQALILGLSGVREHERATATLSDHRSTATSTGARHAGDLTVERRPVQPGRGAVARTGAVAAGLTALAGIVIVAVVASSLRPNPAVGGPSASVPAAAACSASPSASSGSTAGASGSAPPQSAPPSGIPSASPAPTSAAAGGPIPGAPRSVFWTRTSSLVTLWSWDPAGDGALRKWLDIETWDIGFGPSYGVTVLVSPDGSRFAVHEHQFGDPASHDRTRVFDATGRVLLTIPDGQPMTIDMAWSADSTALARSTTDGRWTVARFGANGSVTATPILLPAISYRLIGFDGSGTRLVACETSGEAEFWQKPVTVDLASGRTSTLETWPAGIGRNSTAPVDQINPAGGSAVVQRGLAKGTPVWVLRDPTGEQPLNIDSGAQVQWVGSSTIAWLQGTNATFPAPSGSGQPEQVHWVVSTRSASDTGPGLIAGQLARSVGEAVDLRSTRAGFALVGSRPATPARNGDAGWSAFALVDLARGAVAEIAAPAPTDSDGLRFAGWIEASNGGPAPSDPPAESARPTASGTPQPPATPIPAASSGFRSRGRAAGAG